MTGILTLRNSESRVEIYTEQLMQTLEDSAGTVLDMAKWFNFYSFDVMGDLAFGKPFDMIKYGIVHDYMAVVHTNILAIGTHSHLIWMLPIINAIPGLNRHNEKFQKWLYEHVRQRREVSLFYLRQYDFHDAYVAAERFSRAGFSWILDEHDAIERPTKQDITDLHGDTELIVVAGSDTTAATLACLFNELAKRPDVTNKLQAEVDQYYEDNEGPVVPLLANLEYLQAGINETLRLYRAVPSGVQRMNPPEGLQIGDTFIPGNTIMQVPMYTMQREMNALLSSLTTSSQAMGNET